VQAGRATITKEIPLAMKAVQFLYSDCELPLCREHSASSILLLTIYRFIGGRSGRPGEGGLSLSTFVE